MALLKIFKGSISDFENKIETKNAVNGYCYFVEDTGKFYIDTGTGNPDVYRKVLNAECADYFYNIKTITLGGDVAGRIESDFNSDITAEVVVNNAAKVANGMTLTCTDVNGTSRINTSFNGSATASFALTPEKLFPLTTITKSINLNANSGDWVDLGNEGSAIPNNGSYMI